MLITQHYIVHSKQGKVVQVVFEDTDMFMLLFHHYNMQCTNSRTPMIMSSLKSGRPKIDIREPQ